MYLWRPAVNNQRYAFTPLLDNSEDENDDDELFNSQIATYDVIKHRQLESQARENRGYDYNADEKLEVSFSPKKIFNKNNLRTI